ncbi:MAG: hypothetical protein ACR2GG_06865 [Gemmatimonadaceae bacterium]
MSAQAQPFRNGAGPLARPLAVRAIVAGIIGGIIVDLFLIVTRMAPFPGIYQFIASTLVGEIAFTSPSYIWLGVAMHFVISIVWALIYAYVANAAHALQKWLLGGLVFGVVVMIVMQIIQVVMGIAQPVSVGGIVVNLISHVVFFGLPIAWYLSLPYRRAHAV